MKHVFIHYKLTTLVYQCQPLLFFILFYLSLIFALVFCFISSQKNDIFLSVVLLCII